MTRTTVEVICSKSPSSDTSATTCLDADCEKQILSAQPYECQKKPSAFITTDDPQRDFESV